MALLELREVTVRFGGNVAVDRVSMVVEPGTITGLIGPNGAGKTTTFNVITGLQPPTSGLVLLDGADLRKAKAHKRAQLGISRTFQRIEVFGSLTARENVLVACELRRRWGRRVGVTDEARHLLALLGLVDGDASDREVNRIPAGDEADALLRFAGVDDVAATRADELPTGLARLVELARALATRPRLLLLDEPASGLDEQETEGLALLLGQLTAAGDGLGVLLVEHDVPLVMRLCSTVHVLDFGALLASGRPEEVQRDQRVIEAYLGAGS